MINTIMFDLDGTLLSMDTEEFIKKYFHAVSITLKDYFSPEEVVKYFWSSTQYMIKNTDPNLTNQEAFFKDFYQYVNKDDIKDLNDTLDYFYNNDFNKVKEVSEVSQEIIKSVELLKDKGYDLVVATNPLFPKAAILNRIEWAGLDKDDFIFITSFEDMHFTKPHVDYYAEILEKIDKKPSETMMIGNDIDEDMIAKEIGIETYLIKDNLIGEVDNSSNIDYQGHYPDFYEFVKELPKL